MKNPGRLAETAVKSAAKPDVLADFVPTKVTFEATAAATASASSTSTSAKDKKNDSAEYEKIDDEKVIGPIEEKKTDDDQEKDGKESDVKRDENKEVANPDGNSNDAGKSRHGHSDHEAASSEEYVPTELGDVSPPCSNMATASTVLSTSVTSSAEEAQVDIPAAYQVVKALVIARQASDAAPPQMTKESVPAGTSTGYTEVPEDDPSRMTVKQRTEMFERKSPRGSPRNGSPQSGSPRAKSSAACDPEPTGTIDTSVVITSGITLDAKSRCESFGIGTPVDPVGRSRSVTPRTHRKIEALTQELEREREDRVIANAAHAAMKGELEKAQRHGRALEERLLTLSCQMAEIVNNQKQAQATSDMTGASSSSAGVSPPPGLTLTAPPTVTGLTDSSDSGEACAVSACEPVFHDANSMADSFEITAGAPAAAPSMIDSTTSIEKGWTNLTGDEV